MQKPASWKQKKPATVNLKQVCANGLSWRTRTIFVHAQQLVAALANLKTSKNNAPNAAGAHSWKTGSAFDLAAKVGSLLGRQTHNVCVGSLTLALRVKSKGHLSHRAHAQLKTATLATWMDLDRNAPVVHPGSNFTTINVCGIVQKIQI